MRKQLVFGVDAGGTKTKVLLGEVVDGQLLTIGASVGAAANPRSVGFEAAFESIKNTLHQAYASAGREFFAADAACLSVAGAGRANEQQRILDWCANQGLAKHAVVAGDAESLLASTTDDASGIALIAGTGSLAWGRNLSKQTARAGGCGYLFDDWGSGYWLAAQALNRVCSAGDARKASTTLVSAVLDHLQLSTPEQLIGWCYESPDPRTQIAALAAVVFQEYVCDPIAKEIVDEGARTLASLVIAVASELAFPPSGYTLACAGSVLLKQPLYRGLVEAELERQQCKPREVCYVADPAMGALRIAWRNTMDGRACDIVSQGQ